MPSDCIFYPHEGCQCSTNQILTLVNIQQESSVMSWWKFTGGILTKIEWFCLCDQDFFHLSFYVRQYSRKTWMKCLREWITVNEKAPYLFSRICRHHHLREGPAFFQISNLMKFLLKLVKFKGSNWCFSQISMVKCTFVLHAYDENSNFRGNIPRACRFL